jgi:hypothetical protein
MWCSTTPSRLKMFFVSTSTSETVSTEACRKCRDWIEFDKSADLASLQFLINLKRFSSYGISVLNGPKIVYSEWYFVNRYMVFTFNYSNLLILPACYFWVNLIGFLVIFFIEILELCRTCMFSLLLHFFQRNNFPGV